MGETYLKVRGPGVDLHRAVDQAGRPVDFLLRNRPHRACGRAVVLPGDPPAGSAGGFITLDGHAASHRAVAKLKAAGALPDRVQVRSCKYLNNLVEQDHRRIKQRLRPMLGFKRFETAAVTLRGIELAEKIKKGQFRVARLNEKIMPMPAVWQVVLAA